MTIPITNITLEMTDKCGNAFSVIGRARRALRNGGRADLIDQFTKECVSGTYDNMIAVCRRYFVIK